VLKVQHKPIKRSKLGFKRKEQKKPKRTLVWCTGLSGAPGSVQAELFTFGFLENCSAIIHRAVRWVIGLSGGSPNCPVCQRSNDSSATVDSNGHLQKRYSARTVRAESEQRQKVHRTMNNACPVRQRSVRCPKLSELQRSKPSEL
jgi:hypothetical protein